MDVASGVGASEVAVLDLFVGSFISRMCTSTESELGPS